MPNLNEALRAEILRLARKEVKVAIEPIRKANAGYRRDIAELKRRVEALQKDLRTRSKASPSAAEPAEATETATRFSVKGLKSLRARLGLSVADFGRLVGASAQSVYNWEAGTTVPRPAQQAALVAVRGIGKREAATRLYAAETDT